MPNQTKYIAPLEDDTHTIAGYLAPDGTYFARVFNTTTKPRPTLIAQTENRATLDEALELAEALFADDSDYEPPTFH